MGVVVNLCDTLKVLTVSLVEGLAVAVSWQDDWWLLQLVRALSSTFGAALTRLASQSP